MEEVEEEEEEEEEVGGRRKIMKVITILELMVMTEAMIIMREVIRKV